MFKICWNVALHSSQNWKKTPLKTSNNEEIILNFLSAWLYLTQFWMKSKAILLSVSLNLQVYSYLTTKWANITITTFWIFFLVFFFPFIQIFFQEDFQLHFTMFCLHKGMYSVYDFLFKRFRFFIDICMLLWTEDLLTHFIKL